MAFNHKKTEPVEKFSGRRFAAENKNHTMKNIIPGFAILLSTLAACQGTSTKTTSSDAEVGKTQLSMKQCFQHIAQKDSAFLSLDTKNNQVSGQLSYRLYEKDKNNGTVAGVVKGDTIIADYTFQSEGMTSTRQVVWLKKNGQLLEATGDIEEVNGKMKFKNLSKLSFGKSMIFEETTCK